MLRFIARRREARRAALQRSLFAWLLGAEVTRRSDLPASQVA